MKMHVNALRFRLTGILLFACLLSSGQSTAKDTSDTVQSVLQAYLQAIYARDSDAAYALLSEADQQAKTLPEYRSENGGYANAQLVLSRELAQAIEFGDMTVETDDGRATAMFSVAMPDANHSSLKPIVEGFAASKLSVLEPADLALRREQIHQLASTDALSMIVGNQERWELVKEDGRWRVFENWSNAIMINFDSLVVGELGWTFEPVRSRVLAQPGQTIEMAYRVVNVGPQESTGKARHIIGPHENAEYLEIVSCFCFLEQTLVPGESLEMPLVFRVDFNVPEEISTFSVMYEFYPLSAFPEDSSV